MKDTSQRLRTSAAQLREEHGPTLDLLTATRLLGISRNTGYVLAQAGTFPCACFKVGQQYRVPTEALIRLLRLDVDREQPPERAAA